MNKAVIHIVFFGLISGLTKGTGVLPDDLNAAVGGNVMFTTTLDPTPTPFQSIVWQVNGNLIVISTPTSTTPAVGYEDRVTVDTSTGSMELRSVSENDSGAYTVTTVTQTGVHTGQTTLNVQFPVSNVEITPSSTDLIEFSSVRLSCSSPGSSPSFRWFNVSSEVTASDRVQITDGGSTMTIVSVSRYDQGPFKCVVFNLVSNGPSRLVNFTISYGPENVTLQVSPSQKYHPEGSDVTLSCSAVSEPPAEFSWFLNEVPQSGSEKEFRLRNIQMHQSGSYSCWALNTKTMKNETSQPLLISVLKNISDVSVNSSTAQPVEGQSLNLTCDASGSVFNKRWMKDGSNLISTDNIMFYDNNTVLSFKNLNRNDRGRYTCRVINPISSDSFTYNVVVNYGPENVQIKDPGKVSAGTPLTLRCSAESTPTATYTWKHNGTVIHHSSEFTKNSTEFSDSGEYICQATNSITDKTDSKTLKLEVTEIISDVSVNSSTALPVEGQSLNLSCDASGSMFTKEWMKDGSNLNSTDNIMFYDDNTVLSFKNLHRNDRGRYTCRVITPISSGSSTYVMVVNYGPENIQINGPSKVSVGTSLTLSCSAESTPTATYTWKHNGAVIHHSSEFTKNSAEFSDSGEYICQATNSITDNTDSKILTLEVTGFVKVPAGLSGGAIAGITCACLIVAVAGAAAGFYFYRKKNEKPRPNNMNRGEKEEHVYENTTSAIYENT